MKFRLLLPLLLFVVTPFLAKAQGPPQIQNLLIELWPEFDRPEVLVIYRVELSADTPLPATLTFELPGYVESMNAVAYAQNNNLLAVQENAIDFTYRDDSLFLTFSTPSPRIQLEYYDDEIITKQDQTRTIDYNFMASYAVNSIDFQIQSPLQAENFSLEPTPDETFTDANSLTYNVVEVTNLAAGDSFSLAATYQRATDALTLELLTPPSEHAEDIIVLTNDPPTDTNVIIAYALAGVGVVLILGAVGHWWWSRSRIEAIPVRRPPAQSRGRTKLPAKKQGQQSAGFCYNCGTALRSDANFCHKCGAERRTQ